MNNSDSAELWNRLYREVSRAEREYSRIEEEMNRIVRDNREGVPLADGAYRRIKIGQEAQRAFAEYKEAVERFRAYSKKGIVPGNHEPS